MLEGQKGRDSGFEEEDRDLEEDNAIELMGEGKTAQGQATDSVTIYYKILKIFWSMGITGNMCCNKVIQKYFANK